MNTPPYAEVESLKRISGLGLATTIMLGIAMILGIVSTWSTWNAYWIAMDYVAGDISITRADLVGAENTISTVSVWFVIGFVAAGLFFLTWLWRARLNAEMLCSARHRRGRGWVIGSWICPVVNLWFPFMIVDDVYRASRPRNSPALPDSAPGLDLRAVPGSRVLGFWWGLWLVSALLNRIAISIWNNTHSVNSIRTTGIVEIFESATTIGAGVALILVVRQISSWQDSAM